MKRDQKPTGLRRVVGTNVRLERVRQGLSQETLAHMVSTTQSHVSEVERGVGAVSIDMLARIAVALRIEPMLLLDPSTGRRRVTLEPAITKRRSSNA